jgi:hypothetical protein
MNQATFSMQSITKAVTSMKCFVSKLFGGGNKE